jgi:CPA1 family monovalent cation:H+ antiporter
MHDSLVTGVFLAMVLLFTAAVVALFSRRVRLPYTILLVIIGLVMGWAARTVPALGVLTSFELTPDMVLYVLLPVLIFESAFNLDVRSLLRNLAPIMVLAVPAVLISTAIVGALVWQVLGLPPAVALLFGALISATDPVAVIALFREMGAPKRLTMLVEGESLFNDGTALVLFKILLVMALAGGLTPAAALDGVAQFLVVFFGGAAVGVGTGYLFSRIIGWVENNRLVEITLTTILAHMTFLAAEHYLHVSGVMATVGAGLTLGSYGRSKVSPAVLEHLEMFWEYAAYVCNSLIFLLVGLSVDMGTFAADIGAMAATAVAVLAARAAAIYFLFPVIARFRKVEPVDLRFQTVIFWGGLRGVLAIAMAVSIPDAVPQKPLLMNLTLGVVLFTLLVNGLSMRRLMGLLKLDRYSLQERLESLQAVLTARQRARAGLDAVAQAGMIGPLVIDAERKRYDREIAALTDALRHLTGSADRSGYRDEVEMILRHALLIEKMAYHRLFVQGMLSEENQKELHHRIDRQLDRVKEGRDLPAMTVEEGLFGRVERSVLHAGSRAPLARPVLARYKTGRIAASYERKRARVMAARTVLRKLDEMEAQRTYDAMPIARAREFYAGLYERTRERLDDIRREFPEYVEKVETGMLRRAGLNDEMASLREQFAEGMLSEKTMHDLDTAARARSRHMRMRPVEELLLPAPALLRKVPFFNELSEEDLAKIAGRTGIGSFLPGEEIVREGERGSAMFLIGRGAVQVSTKDAEGREIMLARLGAGDFFGEIALLHAQPRTATVRAVSPCTLLELRRDDLLPALEHSPRLAEALEQAYRDRVLATVLVHVPALSGLDEQARKRAAAVMESLRIEQGTVLQQTGASVDALYVIRSGEAEAVTGAGVTRKLTAGDHAGDGAFLEGATADETIRALSDLEVYVLRSPALEEALRRP